MPTKPFCFVGGFVISPMLAFIGTADVLGVGLIMLSMEFAQVGLPLGELVSFLVWVDCSI